jgi:hypothetical protein
MLWSLERLRDFALHATDGTIGSVRDAMFDDGDWTVRYLVVDAGPWLFDRRVLIGREALGRPDMERREIRVDLTRRKVQDAPEQGDAPTFGRLQEERLRGHYGWPAYWGAGMAGMAAMPGALPIAPGIPAAGAAPSPPARDSGPGAASDAPEGPALHSVREIEGYGLQASDGGIGTVADALIDGADWRLRYWVVDTGTWLPGRKVVVAREWVTAVDWAARRLEVDVTRERVEKSPPLEDVGDLARSYEETLYGWYGRAPYW